MDLEQSNVHIRGYDGNSKPCCGKAIFQRNSRKHEEEVFFSNEATANYLSRGACLALGIIPKSFPHGECDAIKSEETGAGQNPRNMSMHSMAQEKDDKSMHSMAYENDAKNMHNMAKEKYDARLAKFARCLIKKNFRL